MLLGVGCPVMLHLTVMSSCRLTSIRWTSQVTCGFSAGKAKHETCGMLPLRLLWKSVGEVNVQQKRIVVV